MDVQAYVIYQGMRVWRICRLLRPLYISRQIELRSKPELRNGHVAGEQRVLHRADKSEISRSLRTYALGITDTDVASRAGEVKKDSIAVGDVTAQNQIAATSARG